MAQAPKSRRTSRLGKIALVALSAGTLTVGLTGSASAAVLTPLSEATTTFQKTFRPYFDYDSNGCLPAAAIDSSGRVNGGLDDSGSVTGQCRSGHLGKANTYSRVKCNNGWCGIVYTLYFEKDMSCDDCTATSHRHDWEAAVLWVRQGDANPTYASVSAHGNYTTRPYNQVERSGTRLKVVYHKDGVSTHTFRFAKSGETAEAWGDGGWDQPALVSWNSMPSNLQGILNTHTWGDANFPLKDARFATELGRAKPSGIPFDVNGAG